MPVDVSIYSRNPLKSVTDYENEFDRQQLQKQTIQSNALALQTGQLGLQDRARASAESNALRAAMGSGLDIRTPEGQAKAMTIAPNAAGPVIKALTDAAHTGAQTGEITAKTDTEKLKRFMQGHEWAMQKLPTVTNPAEIVQWATEAHKHGAFGDSDQAFVAGLTKALSAAQTPEGFAEWKNNSIKSGMKIKDQLPTNLTVDTGGGQAFVSRDAVTGRVTPMGEIPKTPSPDAVLRSQTEQTVAGMRQDQRAPVAVLDSAGNAVYVPPSEAIGKTPAKMGNELSPADKQKREAAYPTMTKSVQTFDSTSDRLIKDLQDLKNHPGLGSITGIAAGRLPGITDQGRAAQALYDKIVARGGFQELADMRAASPTGGALGNVSNMEGQQLKSAFGALDRRQEKKDVQTAIDDVIAKVGAAKKNIRDAYDLTYEYRTPTKSAPKASVSNW